MEISRRNGQASRCPVHDRARHYDLALDRWACPETGAETCDRHMTEEEQTEHPWLTYMAQTTRRARLEDPTGTPPPHSER